jgi:hypothetical protein
MTTDTKISLAAIAVVAGLSGAVLMVTGIPHDPSLPPPKTLSQNNDNDTNNWLLLAITMIAAG